MILSLWNRLRKEIKLKFNIRVLAFYLSTTISKSAHFDSSIGVEAYLAFIAIYKAYFSTAFPLSFWKKATINHRSELLQINQLEAENN